MTDEGIPQKQPISERQIGSICFEAYQQVAKDLGRSVDSTTTLAECVRMTDILYKELRRRYPGNEINKMRGQFIIKDYPGLWEHYFIKMENGNGESYILDTTWQQHLPKADNSLPRVMFVAEGKLEETLTRFGIASKSGIWKKAQPVPVRN